ncbi:phosphate:acyl-[acyl carrier protein] acyltransferase [Lishizhenia tianjinensis]|uniref:Phosphate acyltransferase n=1 Tax=Lishizhenia tianjinensis TaxID=477690 RepID=A0A1I7BGD9_9FLAO|nr:phosphate acyltransferase PlsX [Lishizhenia tianjinensis]SFT86212.1 phosphate:acyl-[acyl carrier protein] acyltransferase [Lishizhenia tianjinensis]
MKIGLDIMGGDFAPEANVSGAILANKELPQDTSIVLFGDQDVVREKLVELGGNPDDFEIVHAPDVITMHDHPTRAIPQKPNSTISKGFDLLASGEIQAFASTGNTGAMLVGAIYKVNAVPGIIRPCITSTIPNIKGGNSLILDVGANADCKPDVLYQFAILGSMYAKEVYGIENPKVGLLNIGEEETKGNLLTQSAFKLMQDTTDFNFTGNIEGRDIFTGKVDVIVCDGFTGNVVLKQAEGLFGLMQKRGLRDEYFDRFNYENYGGTPILGVNSNVIIGHGISNDIAVKNMLLHSYDVTKSKLTDKIKEAIN